MKLTINSVRGRLRQFLFTVPVGLYLAPTLLAGSTDLRPIDRPDLGGMEPQVEAQFQESLQALDEILDSEGVSDADLAEVFGSTGQLFMLYDFVDSAEKCFLNAVSLAPDQFRWLYYLGVVQKGQGQLEQATSTFEQALQIRPNDLPSLIRAARIELDNIQLERAETRFQQVLTLDPGNAAAHYGLGRIAMLREDFPGAIIHFEEALARQPQASTAHYQLGLAYRESGQIEQARSHLALQGRTDIEFDDPLMQELRELVRGSSLFVVGATRAKAAGEWQEAIKLFELALAADPENNAARLALATTYIQAGNTEAATRELDHALRLDPENLAGHYNLGTILGGQGRSAEAIAHLERAIAIDPEFEIAHINLAVILARQGDLDKAEHHYTQALRVQPDDVEARQQRAQVLLRLQRIDEAIPELEWLAGEQPTSVDAQVELARALGTAGRYGDAADRFGRALEIAPGDIELQYARGLALLFAERYGEARDHLELSVRQSPQSLPLRHLLARFLATSPEATLRDGPRALQMAQEVMRAQPIPEHAETVAMAFAETGEFEQASSIQRQIITRVGANADAVAGERFRRYLGLYEKHEPVRAPWLADRP